MVDLERWIPVPTPETKHYWDGAKAGKLLLQRCDDCGNVYFPPRSFCCKCCSRDIEIFEASGRGILLSYIISHRDVPGYTAPYSIAIVELEEGPRMISNIVGCGQVPEALVLDMPVEVTFLRLSDEIYLPQFRPAGA